MTLPMSKLEFDSPYPHMKKITLRLQLLGIALLALMAFVLLVLELQPYPDSGNLHGSLEESNPSSDASF